MTARNNRKRKFEASTRKIQLLVFVLLTIFPLSGCIQRDPEPIRIGILHSLSGTMAGSESALVDAALLAVEEINESGGILGRTIDPVVAD